MTTLGEFRAATADLPDDAVLFLVTDDPYDMSSPPGTRRLWVDKVETSDDRREVYLS